jgi:hypothetical protein
VWVKLRSHEILGLAGRLMSFDDSANRRCVLTRCRNRGRPGNSLLTRAREGALARAPSASHILGSWQAPPCASCARTAAVDPDGNVVTIPRLPSVTGAHKPPGWSRWSPAEKVEHLLGMSLDRMHDDLSWPADGLDPYRLAAQAQVVRVVAMVAAKVGVEARRERDRERVLRALSPGLRARLRDGAEPET